MCARAGNLLAREDRQVVHDLLHVVLRQDLICSDFIDSTARLIKRWLDGIFGGDTYHALCHKANRRQEVIHWQRKDFRLYLQTKTGCPAVDFRKACRRSQKMPADAVLAKDRLRLTSDGTFSTVLSIKRSTTALMSPVSRQT